MSTVAEAKEPAAPPAVRKDPWNWGQLVWSAVAGVLVAGGVVMRFIAPPGLWLDEAQSVAIARLPITHGLFPALREDGSPPLYYLLLHVWMAVFGSSDVAVRSFSGLLSVLALPLAWLAARRLGSRRARAAVLVLLATNPWAIRYASETRMYSLMALLVLLGLLALQRLQQRPAVRSAVLLAVVSGALMLTHYWSFFLLAVAGGGLLLYGWRRKRRWALLAAGAIAAGVVFFLPWLPSFLYQLAYTGTPWAPRAVTKNLEQVPFQWSGGSTALTFILWPLMVLGTVPAVSEGSRVIRLCATAPVRAMAAVVAGTVLLAWAASAGGYGAFVIRYTAVVVPLAILVAAFGAVQLPAPATATVLVLAALLGLKVGWKVAEQPRTEAGNIAAALAVKARPGDTVAFCPDQLGPSTARALAARHVTGLTMLTYPTAAAPDRVDWVNYANRGTLTHYTAFAAMLAGRTPAPHHVFVVYGKGYRTYGNSCAELESALDARLGKHTNLVASHNGFYEHMQLDEWPTGS